MAGHPPFPSECVARVIDASAAYPASPPLWSNLNLDIKRGETFLISGDNGSGKTSLLKILRGDLVPQSGRVLWLDGNTFSDSRIVARKIAALISPFQALKYANSTVTTMDVLSRGIHDEFSGYESSPEKAAEIARAYSADNLLNKKLASLSQGQARLIFLLRALSRNPLLLLLDEYSEGLDKNTRISILAALEKFSQTGSVVMTSHRREDLPDFIKNTLELSPVAYSAPRADARPRRQRSTSAPPVSQNGSILRLENVNVYINGSLVLKNINWIIRQGENWRVNGDNGAGKSTLLRLLAGDENVAFGGLIERRNRSGELLRDLESIRKNIRLVSFKSQADYGYPLSCLDFISAGFDNSVGKYREYSSEEKAEAMDLLRLIKLENLAGASIRELSSGQLARLCLARAMAGKPELLLLDEACSGLDVSSRRFFLNLLDKLASGDYWSVSPQIVMVSHYDVDIPACVNREATMAGGELMIV
ncbi:MAG: ATP-binding cassette domain-containing protein [Desulfovibrio sp.]|nr:ATP-binding cassette domain-containing protein [Desulfovibrio sp.]